MIMMVRVLLSTIDYVLSFFYLIEIPSRDPITDLNSNPQTIREYQTVNN
jgi:hypothetical protein